jgi:hypothetical protein
MAAQSAHALVAGNFSFCLFYFFIFRMRACGVDGGAECACSCSGELFALCTC